MQEAKQKHHKAISFSRRMLALLALFFLGWSIGCLPPNQGVGQECTANTDCEKGELCLVGYCNNARSSACQGILSLRWQFRGVERQDCPEGVTSVLVKVWDPNGNPIHYLSDGDSYACEREQISLRTSVCGLYKIELRSVSSGQGLSTWKSEEASFEASQTGANSALVWLNQAF